MSAIFGKYNVDGKPIEREIVQKQHEIMRHWSPDTEGVWYDETVGLGHLMLHNSPESLHEVQPLQDKEARLTIVADAILYNREELFRKLNITSNDPVKISDSYLILESYKKWGEKCCEHFNGDFAFVIWDARKQQIYCGRDHMGVRPFFYTYNKQFFAFASQLRGVLSIPQVSRELNDNYIFEFLYDGYPYKKTTSFYQHINRLEPAHYMIVTREGVQSYKYWELDITKEIRYPKEEDYVEEARHLLRQAVNSRMRTAFPVGSQLSGGLDSSGVSILAAQEAREKNIPFSVYCNVMPEELLGKVYPYKDDRDLIHEVCRAGNITNINYIDFKDKDIEFFVNDPAGEYADIGFRTFFKGMSNAHSKAAEYKNVRTILSGLGGDEVVSSVAFNYLYELLISFKWKTLINEIKEEKEFAIPNNRFRSLMKIFLFNFSPKTHYLYYYLKDRKIFYDDHFIKEEYIPAYLKHKRLIRIQNVKECQLSFLNSGLVLRLETENLTSLHYRVNNCYPLIDINLLSFFISIPSRLKRQNGYGRYLYRCIFENQLPNAVLKQVKIQSGSTVPGYNQALKVGINKLIKKNIENNYRQTYRNIDIKKLIECLEDINSDKNLGNKISIINTLEIILFFNKIFKNNKKLWIGKTLAQ